MKNKTFNRTPKSTLQARKIVVFCPKNAIPIIKEISQKYNFDVLINEYNSYDSETIICHYQNTKLDKDAKDFLIDALEKGKWVEPLVSYLDRRLGYIEVNLLESNYFLHQKAFSILSDKTNQSIKRLIDIIIAITLGVMTLPITILTAFLIKLESPGPIFFKQLRTGQYNKEFHVIKFRSMRNDAEKNGAQWATKNDSRVTRVGKFIRKTRIDELPQIINVLQGDMSMVGPRPEREVFIKELEAEIPYYRFRHAVKPGITGLAQVKYAYGASVEDAIWKHKFDIHYIKHQGFTLDLKVILLTFKTVLFGMGR